LCELGAHWFACAGRVDELNAALEAAPDCTIVHGDPKVGLNFCGLPHFMHCNA
jgi:hypothetical protein